MADFDALKLEVATETNRDDIASGGDIEGTLEKHIQDACEFFADTKFWFNSILTTATTSANVATVAIPAGVRIAERVTIPAYQMELAEATASTLPESVSTGMPSRYAYYNDSLRFYLTPDAAYTLNIYGIAQIDAPSAGSDTSVWTNEASRLIRARTKQTLYRGVFRDTEGATLAAAEAQEELVRLKRETARRLVTPLRAPRAGRYSIFADV